MKKSKDILGNLGSPLPNYCKKIGLGLMALVIVMFVLSLLVDFSVGQQKLETFFLNLSIISCALIALSRDKIEDELTNLIKMSACFSALSVGVIIALSSFALSAKFFMVFIFFFYFLFKYILRRMY